MRAKFHNIWAFLKSGYIFVPMAISLASGALALIMPYIEKIVEARIGPGWLYFGEADDVRLILTTIASSMITVAGVVFSITIVVFALTSSQYGSRLLRNFLRDTVTQSVLGAFTGTFIYCMLVLREVRDGFEPVPHLSVSVGVLLTLVSLFVLIYFFHHMAAFIQPENICYAVFKDLEAVIHELMPVAVGWAEPEEKPQEESDLGPGALEVVSGRSGYVESIDLVGLVREAERHDVVLKLQHRASDFVIRGEALCLIWPGGRLGQALRKKIERSFILGARLTLEQDMEFAFKQLVQVAVRALSPAINDPFTAMICVDWLGVAITSVAIREAPSRYLYGSGGELRVIMDIVSFEGITDTAFDQIRQAARNNVAVSIRMLETIKVVAAFARNDGQKNALLRHAEKIRREITRSGIDTDDMNDIEERFRGAVEALKAA